MNELYNDYNKLAEYVLKLENKKLEITPEIKQECKNICKRLYSKFNSKEFKDFNIIDKMKLQTSFLALDDLVKTYDGDINRGFEFQYGNVTERCSSRWLIQRTGINIIMESLKKMKETDNTSVAKMYQDYALSAADKINKRFPDFYKKKGFEVIDTDLITESYISGLKEQHNNL